MTQPAVSDFEWRQFLGAGKDQLLPRYFAHCDHANMIAKHNAALPDSDLRKLTWAHVRLLRDEAEGEWNGAQMETGRRLLALADALSSYLPPEGTDP